MLGQKLQLLGVLTDKKHVQPEFFEKRYVSLQILQTIVRKRVSGTLTVKTVYNSFDEKLVDMVSICGPVGSSSLFSLPVYPLSKRNALWRESG